MTDIPSGVDNNAMTEGGGEGTKVPSFISDSVPKITQKEILPSTAHSVRAIDRPPDPPLYYIRSNTLFLNNMGVIQYFFFPHYLIIYLP